MVNGYKVSACLIIFFLLPFCGYSMHTDTLKTSIPLGGNAWVNGGDAQISNDGVSNWTKPKEAIEIYFRINEPHTLHLSLQLKVPGGESKIRASVGNKAFDISVSNIEYKEIPLGPVAIAKPGYIKLTLKGISKTGLEYAQVNNIVIRGLLSDKFLSYVRNNNDNNFYWGRRGPSVHLNYIVPDQLKTKVSWFYSEVTVPKGMDPVGSYFQANGFNQGYFGFQVNSAQERRVLFSVWSPYQGDDPKAIPDSMKILLVKKGDQVQTGEFGNEGSGSQSYLKYNWKAGQTYGFLIHAEPDTLTRQTVFTAWFKDLSTDTWQLVASFRRPQTISYLQGLYAFNENFLPESGNRKRTAFYSNQWVADVKGNWQPVNEVIFTGDNTAMQGYRMDYAGGVRKGRFYLSNGGFFNNFVPLQKRLNKKVILHQLPKVNFIKL